MNDEVQNEQIKNGRKNNERENQIAAANASSTIPPALHEDVVLDSASFASKHDVAGDVAPPKSETTYKRERRLSLLSKLNDSAIKKDETTEDAAVGSSSSSNGSSGPRKPQEVDSAESLLFTSARTRKGLAKATVEEENESACCECEGGGELICCDTCVRAFHLVCLPQSYRPPEQGDSNVSTEWSCPVCLYFRVHDDLEKRRGVLLTLQHPLSVPSRQCDPRLKRLKSRRALDEYDYSNDEEDDKVEEHAVGGTMQPKRIKRFNHQDLFRQSHHHYLFEDIQKGELQANALETEPPSAFGTVATNGPFRTRRQAAAVANERKQTSATSSGSSTCGTIGRMNVGPSFQVPQLPLSFLEVQKLGRSYDRVLTSRFARAVSDCRVVYSATEWKRRAQSFRLNVPFESRRASVGTSEEGISTGLKVPQTPLLDNDDDDLRVVNEMLNQMEKVAGTADTIEVNSAAKDTFIDTEEKLRQFCSTLSNRWSSRCNWPYCEEYAYKILHHSQFDMNKALASIEDPSFDFHFVCDPPMRPYFNKWRPKDKRSFFPYSHTLPLKSPPRSPRPPIALSCIRKAKTWLSPPLPEIFPNPYPRIHPMLQMTLLAGLANLIMGYFLSVLNTAMSVIVAEFRWCDSETGVAVSKGYENFVCEDARVTEGMINMGVYVGAAAGCLSTGIVMQRIGKRLGLLFVYMGLASASCVTWLSTGFRSLFVARIWTGIFAGLATVIPSIYLVEMSPPLERAFYGLIPTACTNLGVFMGICIGFPLKIPDQGGSVSPFEWNFDARWWRYMVLFPLVPCLVCVYFITCIYTFDTPDAIKLTGRSSKSIESLLWSYEPLPPCEVVDQLETPSRSRPKVHLSPTRGSLGSNTSHPKSTHSNGSKMSSIASDSPHSSASSERASRGPNSAARSWLTLLASPIYCHRLLIGWILASCQQLTGMPVFIATSNAVFAQAQVPSEYLSITSAAMAFLQFVCSAVSAQQIIYWNRRVFLGGGVALMGAALIPTAVAGLLRQEELQHLCSVLSTLIFAALYGLTIGPGLFVYLNEMLPAEVKEIGLSIAFCLNWLSCLVVIIAASSLDQLTIFLTFSAVCFLTAMFVWAICPETKPPTRRPLGTDIELSEARHQGPLTSWKVSNI